MNVLRLFFAKLLEGIFTKLPLQRKVVFQNFDGKGFGCNPKAIAIALNEIDPSIKCIWLTSGPNYLMPDWITPVSNIILKKYHLATSKVWVDNTRCGCRTHKRKNQFYIQTWHAGFHGKKVENDAVLLPDHYRIEAQYDSSITDLMVSDSQWCSELYRKSFWYGGEILEVGSPRCDFLINYPNGNGSVHRYFKLDRNVPLVLYAPTFRAGGKNVYNIDWDNVLPSLRSKFGRDFKLIIRMHPNISTMDFGFKYGEDILNGTDYPDMYELLAECDIEINDYSSSMFEFALLHKPVFLFTPDSIDYEKERGFYFPLESLPFPLSRTNSELIEIITNFDNEKYIESVENFFNDYSTIRTGHASIDVAKRIVQEINKL